jgi:hypothetical protein
MDLALRERELRPVRDPFGALLGLDLAMGGNAAGGPDPGLASSAATLYANFLRAAAELAPGRIDQHACMDDFLHRLRQTPSGRAAGMSGQVEPTVTPSQTPARAFVLPWIILRPLCGADPADSRVVSWIEEWMLVPLLRDYLVRQGWDAESGEAFSALLSVALRLQSMQAGLMQAKSARGRPAQKPTQNRAAKSTASSHFPWHDLLSYPAAERFLRVNHFEGVRWFNREALSLLLQCMETVGPTEMVQEQATLIQIAKECRYQWEPFLALLGNR